jgi:hypothetical protein
MTPAKHKECAERLLEEIAESRDFSLPHIKVKLQLAQIHSQLALYPGGQELRPEPDDHDMYVNTRETMARLRPARVVRTKGDML